MSNPISTLPEGYTLHPTPPPLPSYLHLRRTSGLTPITSTQGERALSGCWFCLHITYTPPENASTATTDAQSPPEIVGIGRIIGDGGWYFHIVDVAVLPTHQRRGLGNVIMATLLERIKALAEPGFYVNLFADLPGRKLYQRWGFRDTMPGQMGMCRWIGGKGEVKEEMDLDA